MVRLVGTFRNLCGAWCRLRWKLRAKFKRLWLGSLANVHAIQGIPALLAPSKMKLFMSLASSTCASFNALLLDCTVFLILTGTLVTYFRMFLATRIVVLPAWISDRRFTFQAPKVPLVQKKVCSSERRQPLGLQFTSGLFPSRKTVVVDKKRRVVFFYETRSQTASRALLVGQTWRTIMEVTNLGGYRRCYEP